MNADPCALAGEGGALAGLVARHTGALRRSGSYVPPPPEVLDALPALLGALAAGGSVAAPAAELGLHASTVQGRVVLHPPTPGGAPWVLLAVPAGEPGVLVEVPHPYADLHTEVVALEMVARLPRAVLLVAGAHRAAGGPSSTEDGPPGGGRDRAAYPADVAVRADALFSRMADGLVGRRRLPQVQVHGFADRGGVDIVISAGVAAPGPLLTRVRAELVAAGLRVAGPEDLRRVDLLGRRNVQGRSAARHGAAFVHLELSWSVRRDHEARGLVVAAVAAGVSAAAP